MSTAGVLLAAGAGARFGGDKLSALIDGRTVLSRAAAPLAAAGLDPLILVTRPGGPTLAGWRPAINPAPEQGLSSSLRVGLAAAAGAQRIVVALGDMPFVQAATIRALLDAWRPGDLAAVPVCGGAWGNPVLIGREAADLCAGLRGDRGLRAALEAARDRVRAAAVADEGVLRDIDRPEDLFT